jgi:predicted phosphate transport protein (TIGR00153 family)
MLFSKRKGNMQELLLEHTRLVLDCVDNFQNMVESLRLLDLEKARKFEEAVEKFETAADEVHRENVNHICRGSFFGYMREDILQFMELTDSVADSAKEASRALTLRKVPEQMLTMFLTDTVMDYVKESANTAKSLLEVIKSLSMKREIVIEKVRIVEQFEENADSLKNKLFQELYSKSEQFDTLTVLQFKEFIDATDRIADSAEDASDVVLIIIAKGYS